MSAKDGAMARKDIRPVAIAGTLEFGANKERGWPLAGTIVPIAYIAWSLWLVALGFALLLT